MTTSQNDMVLSSVDNSNIFAVAGAGSIGIGGGVVGGGIASVGASVADDDIGNEVRATISGSDISSGGGH